jgi:hypothetical protein
LHATFFFVRTWTIDVMWQRQVKTCAYIAETVGNDVEQAMCGARVASPSRKD